MKQIRIFACLVAVPIAASADVNRVHERIVSDPNAGVVRTVSVGSIIREQGRFYIVDEAITTVSRPMRGGRWVIPLTVNPDQPLTQVSSNAKFKACTNAGTGPCGLDDDGNGTFDRMAQDSVSLAVKLKEPVPYVTKTQTRVVDDPKNFKQVILYTGATGDTLRLSYREFSNNMARPAFTEELTIPLSKQFPQDVAVKDVRIRIHKIDGLGLTYEILPVVSERG